MDKRIKRIMEMESIFDLILKDPRSVRNDPKKEILYRRLVEYYESPLWMEDYTCDERGELPRDLKRGILSEDGIYNLIAEVSSYEREDSMNLKGFHAVITGASDGLGYCMAAALLRAGATVGLAARPSEKLTRAVNSLKDEGLDAHALPMDVRSEDSVRSAAQWVKDNWGKLDLLVNNAGLGMARVNPDFMTTPKKFFEMDVEGFRDVVDTNLNGYFIVSKYFVPIMIAQGRGRIANVTTGFGTMTRAHMAPYGASRAGSEAFTKIMEAELKEYGICVNVIMPGGAARTGLLGPVPVSDEVKEKMLPPDVMDETILFLASPEAEGLTGARITATQLDGWLKENGYR